MPLTWDDGPAWELHLRLCRRRDSHVLDGELRRGNEKLPLAEPELLLGDVLVFGETVAALDAGQGRHWLDNLRLDGPIEIPKGEEEEVVAELHSGPGRLRLDLPKSLRIPEAQVEARPHLQVTQPRPHSRSARLQCELSFEYDGLPVHAGQPGWAVVAEDPRRLLLRDTAAEARGAERLHALGVRRIIGPLDEPGLELSPRHLPQVVQTLVGEGWHVEADGRLHRRTGSLRFEVRSGTDWFELEGRAEFEGQVIPLPEVLAALHRSVSSHSATARWVCCPRSGSTDTACSRSSAPSTATSCASATGQPGRRPARAGARGRRRRRVRKGAKETALLPRYQATGETPRLRGHAARLPARGSGLAAFSRRLRLRRLPRRRHGPGQDRAGARAPRVALATPRSGSPAGARRRPALPRLQLEGRGGALCAPPGGARTRRPGRSRDPATWQGYDIVLTTYGTLRRDALLFQEALFDYVVLDEAQAIKNSGSKAARAVRLLNTEHRLALSGTPIENHLGELWSLMDFLDPGMLGLSSAFKKATTADSVDRQRLSHALRPFILRRTKDQVGQDLPPRTEQTLEGEQKRLYTEIRDHYRQSLLKRVANEGIARSKMHVLEALLRLRQFSCHAGLVDPKQAEEPGAKIQALLPSLMEVLDEGHKALVFSQFTSLIALLEPHLLGRGVVLRNPRRQHPQPQSARPALPGRRRLQALPDQPQGRRPRPQPYRRRVRLPPRPLVEPGRRGPGHRPRPPRRPDAARVRLPPDREGHGRREGSRPATGEAQARRRHSGRRRWRRPEGPPPRRRGAAPVVR